MTRTSEARPSNAGLGVVLVAAGAVCYGLLPLVLEILREEQVGSGSSLLVRYGGSAVLLAAWIAWRRPQWRCVGLCLAAGFGLGGGTIFLFEGYARLPASITILIFYTYPAFTLVAARLLFGVGIEPRMICAIILVLLSAALILSPGNLAGLPLAAVAFAFVAPLGYALYLSCLGRIPEDVDAGLRTLLVTVSALAVTAAWHFSVEDTIEWPMTGAGWAALAWVGIGTGLLATCLVIVGTSMAGSGRSAVAGSSELVTVLLLGWIILGEAVRLEAATGAVLILAAIMVSLPRRRQARDRRGSSPRPPGTSLPSGGRCSC